LFAAGGRLLAVVPVGAARVLRAFDAVSGARRWELRLPALPPPLYLP
jgi:hypothetical protein